MRDRIQETSVALFARKQITADTQHSCANTLGPVCSDNPVRADYVFLERNPPRK